MTAEFCAENLGLSVLTLLDTDVLSPLVVGLGQCCLESCWHEQTDMRWEHWGRLVCLYTVNV